MTSKCPRVKLGSLAIFLADFSVGGMHLLRNYYCLPKLLEHSLEAKPISSTAFHTAMRSMSNSNALATSSVTVDLSEFHFGSFLFLILPAGGDLVAMLCSNIRMRTCMSALTNCQVNTFNPQAKTGRTHSRLSNSEDIPFAEGTMPCSHADRLSILSLTATLRTSNSSIVKADEVGVDVDVDLFSMSIVSVEIKPEMIGRRTFRCLVSSC
jgi:hypothetical protein